MICHSQRNYKCFANSNVHALKKHVSTSTEEENYLTCNKSGVCCRAHEQRFGVGQERRSDIAQKHSRLAQERICCT